jgi:serine/threonine protein kinase
LFCSTCKRYLAFPSQEPRVFVSMTDVPTKRIGAADAAATHRAHVSVSFSPSVPSRYQIVSEIGRGGMGIVYKVRDLETNEVIALKVLRPDIAVDETMRETLRKEVRLARKVTHKNVCRIHEFNRTERSACVSMEFVDGESLLSKLRRTGALRVSESVEIARQACAGLREAHAQGIVHRDLKPANIMLDRSGTVKVMDFGIARLSQDTAQLTRTFMGTPNYMSPEQVEMKATGTRADIYSLGLVLYEMVTGVPAFEGENPILVALDQVRRSPQRPKQIVSTIPLALEEVILKCLRKDPHRRYGSVDELDAALQASMRTARPEPLLVRVKLPPAVSRGLNSARAAISSLGSFASGVQFPKDDVLRLWRAGLEKWRGFMPAKIRISAGRSRSVQVGAILATVFFAAVVSFGLVSKPSRSPANPVPSSSSIAEPPAALATTPTTSNVGGSVSPGRNDDAIVSENVDLEGNGNGVAVNPNADLAASDSSSAHADSVSLHSARAATTPDSESAAVLPTGTRPPSNASASHSAARTSAKRLKASPRLVSLPASWNPSAEFQMSLEPVLPVAPQAMDAPHAQKTETNNPSSTSQTASPANPSAAAFVPTYLEVGSFKDAIWGDNAVEQLSRSGFHAESIHKSRLWMQSYHVQVGPFNTREDLEAAEKKLTAQGFEPHVVK